MVAVYNILYSLLILLISETALSGQSGQSSQYSSSSRSSNASHATSTKTCNANSDSNSDTNYDDGVNTGRDTLQKNVTKMSRTIEFKGDTDNKEMKFTVQENEAELTINISSIITEGKLLIEIYNPSGEKIGNCSLDCSESKNKKNIRNEITKLESASCSLSKSYNPPQPGDWKIKISSEKAKGTLKLDVN